MAFIYLTFLFKFKFIRFVDASEVEYLNSLQVGRNITAGEKKSNFEILTGRRGEG